MANQKISQFSVISSLAGADYFPVVQDSDTSNKRVSLTQLLSSIPAGSAASPSIAFIGDNTGIYSPGADQVAISTNGIGRLFVDASGRVGLGATPSTWYLDQVAAALTVARFTHAGGAAFIRINSADSNIAGIQLGGATSPFHQQIVANDSDKSIRFIANANERLRITSDGKLGLGTSSPSVLLQSEQVSAGSSVIGCSLVNNSATAGAGVIFDLTPSTAGPGVRGAQIEAVNTNGFNEISLSLKTSSGGNPPATRLHIAPPGNVGIGTTSPNDILHVVESSASAATPVTASVANFERNGAAGITISSTATTTGSVFFADSGSSAVGRLQYDHNDNSLGFWANSLERARIDSSGRLLVGTSTAFPVRIATTAITPRQQLYGGNGTDSSFVQGCGSTTDSTAAFHWFAKFASGTVNDNTTTVVSGEQLGTITWSGSDGTNQTQAAHIRCEVDGTPGTDDMPGRIVLSTTPSGSAAPVERMRITNAGFHYLYGNTGVLRINSGAAAGTGTAYLEGYYGATSTQSGTRSFLVYTNGDVANTNNVYGAISDIKLKENIVDANSQWDDLKALQVRNYNLKEGQTHTQIGLIAQEVELVSPGLVSESPDRDEEGNDLGTVTKSVNYSVLYMKAVKALQEAMERIETLEAKVAALESA